MWNNITEYAGARNGIADLNSAYYKLIENKTPVVFNRKDTRVPVLNEIKSTCSKSQEFQGGNHGSLLTHSEYPGTPSTSTSESVQKAGNGHHSRNFPTRLKSKTTYTKFPKGSYSNLLASNLKAFNGSLVGLNVANDERPVTGVGRCHSETFPPGHNSCLGDIDKPPNPTQSEQTHSSKKLNPEISFTKRAFDVEEDSQFQFYLEDMDSQGNVKKSCEFNPSLTKVNSSQSEEEEASFPKTSMEKINSELFEEELETIMSTSFIKEEPQPERLESSQFEHIYSNPRYGKRFAYKNIDMISRIGQPASVNSTTKPPELKHSKLKLKVRSISCSAISSRKQSLNLDSIGTQKMKSMEYIKPTFASEIEHVTTIEPTRSAESTQFIVPPMLSESDVSVQVYPSSSATCITENDALSNEDSNDEYETPFANINAIHEYNKQLSLKKEGSPEEEPPADGPARVQIKIISKASSRIQNVPKDSWMMLPIRLLPGAFVPYSPLIYIPLIILFALSISYLIAILL